jgi:hypothetical protein
MLQTIQWVRGGGRRVPVLENWLELAADIPVWAKALMMRRSGSSEKQVIASAKFAESLLLAR